LPRAKRSAAIRRSRDRSWSEHATRSRSAVRLEPRGAGTKYTAIAIHGDEEGAKKHANMGFHDHWGKGLDQLVTLAKKMRG